MKTTPLPPCFRTPHAPHAPCFMLFLAMKRTNICEGKEGKKRYPGHKRDGRHVPCLVTTGSNPAPPDRTTLYSPTISRHGTLKHGNNLISFSRNSTMSFDFTFIISATAFLYIRIHHAMNVSMLWTPSCVLLAGMPPEDIMTHYFRGLLYQLLPNTLLPELPILSQAADVCALVNVRNGVKLFHASRAINKLRMYANGDPRLAGEEAFDKIWAFMIPYGLLFIIGLLLGQRWRWCLGLPIGAAVGSFFIQ